MASNTDPIFARTPILGVAAVSAANTARDGTGTIVDACTAGADGARIARVVVKATGNPADSIVTMFVFDTATYYLYDEYDLGDPAAASTTVEGYRVSRAYDDLNLQSGQKIGFAITVALTAGVMNCFVHGGSLTA